MNTGSGRYLPQKCFHVLSLENDTALQYQITPDETMSNECNYIRLNRKHNLKSVEVHLCTALCYIIYILSFSLYDF